MQQPELCGRHFFEKAADPADEIVAGKEGQIVNADDGGGSKVEIRKEEVENGHKRPMLFGEI